MTVPVVEMRRVSKRFGGVHAVEAASVDLHEGEVVGLVGHNGAGKSTLMKLLSGALAADEGEIRVRGERARIRTPRDARGFGIETLYQDLALADNLDAVANLFLGRERTGRFGMLDEGAMEGAAREVLGRLNPAFTALRVPVAELSGGQRQAVAVARALHFDARVLVMDEPTAALGPQESAMVSGIIRRLQAEGLGIFLVSHDLHDVFDLADRVAVMRAGRVVGIVATRDATPEDVMEMILTGRGSGDSGSGALFSK